jgi:ferritin
MRISSIGLFVMASRLCLVKHAVSFMPNAKQVPVTTTKRSFANRSPTMMVASKTVFGEMSVERKEVEQLFMEQVTNEFSASQLYLSASIWCDRNDMTGMASYMRAESNEERGHGMTLIDFAMKRDFNLSLQTVPAPESDWEGPEELWEALLDGEKDNTQSLLRLADAAQTCHDHSLLTLLMPYHMEQVNSEDKLKTILAKVRDENKTPGLLRQLDTELGAVVGV